MAFSRILEGVAHLGIVVTAPALMAQLSSDKWRGATMSLWSTFFGISFALFAWFGIPLLDTLGVKGLFQMHSIGLVIIAAFIFLFLPGQFAQEINPENGTNDKQVSMYHDDKILWPGVGWLFYTLTFLALLTILPLNLPDETRPQMTTAMSLIGIAVSLSLVPLLLTFMSAAKTVLLGFLIAIIATVVSNELSLLVLALCLFAILGLIQGGTFAAVAELNTSLSDRTLGYGFMAQTGKTGNLIGTPILLYVLDSSGQSTLMLVTSAIYAIGFVSLFVLARRIRAIG